MLVALGVGFGLDSGGFCLAIVYLVVPQLEADRLAQAARLCTLGEDRGHRQLVAPHNGLNAWMHRLQADRRVMTRGFHL